MQHREMQKGDAVYATTTIINDGSVPGCEPGEVFAQPGTMGMLINTGYVELEPDTELFLVSFRMEDGNSGPPVACLADEISPDPLS
ncbi:nitrogen fixation protein NifZ [Pseudomaricurvus sp. HS19]|uniref:nitrogen fixation protein NifZ n=1 Tax=Pseudomaricurvus sp. HS19 TaxID=2692626 RepID=UPI001370CC80|nr:nitrogen fixation protein NifZ [Pseudomaricurvus sp. HS19]MYM62280.1 nitrogen fixation protein NifZ [Pseudomaricurvus sp. HS19]